jgi:hypothetical protein
MPRTPPRPPLVWGRFTRIAAGVGHGWFGGENPLRDERLLKPHRSRVFRNGRSVNLAMVQSGQALAYRKYLAACDGAPFLNAEAHAKQSRLGVWAVSGGSNAHRIGTMVPEEPYP